MSVPTNIPSQQKWQQRQLHLQMSLRDKSWLFDQGSLTQKLLKKSRGKFRVELLQQSIRSVPFSEKKALHLSNRRWAVIREVVLYGNNVPWVYARTVIPLHSIKGRLRRLHYLGNQSLGEHLFNDPTMKREPIYVAKVPLSSIPISHSDKRTVWGRRSIFRLSNKPLLVSEIFLPALFSTTLTPSLLIPS